MSLVIAAALSLPSIAVASPGDGAPGPSRSGLSAYPIELERFQVLKRDSGPRDYYRLVREPGQAFIRGVYSPSLQSVTLFAPVPDRLRQGARLFRFRWRALVLPRGGNECIPDRGDAAANVYLTWKRGMRWYSVKLVWSTEAQVGATCNRTRNLFVASDSVILRSGPPTGLWYEEEVDPEALFRQHFEGGNPDAEVPELQGIGILTDGDQTRSVSAAEFGGFVFYKDERTASR